MSVRKLFDLQGHKAFVTGSGDGIGKAIALSLAEFGADVIVHAKSNAEQCKEVVSEIRNHGVESDFVLADLCNTDSLERVFADVSRVFTPDILVLNASVQVRKSFMEITREEYKLQADINLWSTIRLIQLFSEGMRKNGWGRIVTLGSVQQLKPHKDMAVYSATKSAVVTLVKNLAVQFGGEGITINNLAPGVVKTRRNVEALANEAYATLVQSKIPAGFFAEPQDCGGLAVLLCSDAGRYITGQDIYCDGGMGIA